MTARRAALMGGAVLLLLLPWLPGVPLSVVVNANLAGEYALVAISLVILTGWVGQISLGQGTFVGIGAFATGLLARGLHIPFPANLPIVALITAAAAALLGVVALRVRGLYLAVATLIFAWMADAYLFSSDWLVGQAGASSIPNKVVGRPGTITAFDLSDKRVFYYVIVAAVLAAHYAAQNLRGTKSGRAFFAIRGSEMAAVSLGIDVARYKLLAFAFSGALAGIAGNLLMTDLRTATPVSFQFTVSLFYLSIAVVGGIASVGGAIAASGLFAGLNEVFFRVSLLNGWLDIVTIGLLLAVILGYPGGLGALGPAVLGHARTLWARLRSSMKGIGGSDEGATAIDLSDAALDVDRPGNISAALSRVADGVRSRLRPLRGRRHAVVRRALDLSTIDGTPSESGDGLVATDDATPHRASAGSEPAIADAAGQQEWRSFDARGFALPPARDQRAPILDVRNITVRFGGLTAVDDVSLQVREHEIVGLIGPNGAGKTTLFNAISGLNEPTAGTVQIFGDDATGYPVHVRAQMGVGRTFQLIQLFPQLSVFDNLLVATHVHNETGFFSHLALTGRAVNAEREARHQVRQIVDLLGLHDVVEREVKGLPFGILRQVEIARALVSRAPFVMLDEPASGLDNSETDELARLLYFVRARLGVSILLIEHDVRMVTSVSDYMYVISRGRLLADGTPAEVQRNPEVIAAYLGEAESRAPAAAAAGA